MQTQNIDSATLSDSKTSNFTAVILAGLLGLGLIFLAGFMNVEVAHNATHDTRHSSGFPCH